MNHKIAPYIAIKLIGTNVSVKDFSEATKSISSHHDVISKFAAAIADYGSTLEDVLGWVKYINNNKEYIDLSRDIFNTEYKFKGGE